MKIKGLNLKTKSTKERDQVKLDEEKKMERGEKTGEEMDRGNPKATHPRRSQRIKDARNVKFAKTKKEEEATRER